MTTAKRIYIHSSVTFINWYNDYYIKHDLIIILDIIERVRELIRESKNQDDNNNYCYYDETTHLSNTYF